MTPAISGTLSNLKGLGNRHILRGPINLRSSELNSEFNPSIWGEFDPSIWGSPAPLRVGPLRAVVISLKLSSDAVTTRSTFFEIAQLLVDYYAHWTTMYVCHYYYVIYIQWCLYCPHVVADVASDSVDDIRIESFDSIAKLKLIKNYLRSRITISEKRSSS